MTFLPMQTLKSAAQRIATLHSCAWLPPALLLLALSSVFLFGYDQRCYFYRGSAHSEMSAKNLAIAENLSPEHHFLMFVGENLDADGKHTYEVYNRFPIGIYALIKLAIMPFGDDLSAKISAARMLMLLFFAAAAFMAYLALRRLTSNRWIALSAALLAFSSPYFLYFNDVIASEATVDIFGALLVFHGMVVFEQEGRFRQLLLKTCIALLLGWHVYALLLPYIAFGITRELIKARSAVSSVPNVVVRSLRTAAPLLIHSRHVTLGAVALFFGVSMLTFNFTNEYFALNREIPPTELPSLRSMMYRTGVASEARDPNVYYADRLRWPHFGERQLYRLGAMALPYAFSPSFVDIDKKLPSLFVMYGIAALGASLVGLLFVQRHKICWLSLTLSGFCWTLPMRHNTAQPGQTFEALLYIGVALTLFSLVLLCLRRLEGERLIAALSVITLLVFVVSALRMSHINNPTQTDILHKAAIADFEIIRGMTDDGNLIQIAAIPWVGLPNELPTIDYYLSGRIDIPAHETTPPARPPDLVVSGVRLDGLPSLTPQNRMAFLYQWEDYHTHIDEIIAAQTNEPLTSHGFDVYLNHNTLIYAKDDCSEDDISEKFFLALHPVDESDLPAEARQRNFDNLVFRFQDQAIRRGKRCIVITPLPEYDIARIYTGQSIQRADGSFERLWESEIYLTQ